MMPIEIKSIPHNEHRYETVGDYWYDENGEHLRVSDMQNEDYEFCVALHELVESYLCRKAGIKEEDISAFDIMFEKERAEGKWTDEDEPGHDPRAPYRTFHQFAELIERQMAYKLGMDWDKYDKTVMSL